MSARALSLFSNVGGLDLGLERAGWTPAVFCEIDAKARSVLAYHWPDVPCWPDVTSFDGGAWRGRVDLVAGGSPCTDLSVAGRRAGLGGDESRLFWDQCRVADQSASRWVLWENVAGALSSNGGADFAAVLWGFTGGWFAVPEDGWRSFGVCVGPRRAAVWRLLDARWFGVAQRRRRVFVVGCAVADVERAIAVLAEPEGVRGGARPGGAEGEVVAALTANGVGAGGGADDHAGQAGDLIPTLTTRCGATFDDQQIGQLLLATMQPAVATPVTMRGRDGEPEFELGEPGIYNALRAGDGGSSRQNAVLADMAVRRLTPVECERLMCWPDDHTRWGRLPNGEVVEISDSQRYRMCGLGVVASQAEWIGRRLAEANQPAAVTA